jgi:hypothetical protein
MNIFFMIVLWRTTRALNLFLSMGQKIMIPQILIVSLTKAIKGELRFFLEMLGYLIHISLNRLKFLIAFGILVTSSLSTDAGRTTCIQS